MSDSHPDSTIRSAQTESKREPVSFALPLAGLIFRALAVPVLVALVVTAIHGWSLGVAGSAMSTGVVSVVFLMLGKPWRVRRVDVWPAVLVGLQGGAFLASILSSWLLYSATQPDPLWLGLATTLAYIGLWIAVAKLYERTAKRAADPLG